MKFNLDVYERRYLRDFIGKAIIRETALASYIKQDENGDEDWDEKEEWNAQCEAVIKEMKGNDLCDVFEWISLQRENKRYDILNYIESLKFKTY